MALVALVTYEFYRALAGAPLLGRSLIDT